MVDSIRTDFVSLNQDKPHTSIRPIFSSERLMVLAAVSLVLSLLMERYCFIITVFKTQNYSYIAVLIVSALNFGINAILYFTSEKTEPNRLHEMFQVARSPAVSIWWIALVGILDMLYTFLLFWPATVLSGLLLVTLL